MIQPGDSLTTWDTGLPLDVLKYVGSRSVQVPEDFNLHPHLKKTHVEARLKKLEIGDNIEWGLAEALALGSLLYQGFNVRICGQDVGRATFAHRHAMLVDQESNEVYLPLNNLGTKVHFNFWILIHFLILILYLDFGPYWHQRCKLLFYRYRQSRPH